LLELVWRKPDEDRKSRVGRKPMDVVLMVKTLVPSALYYLSDNQIEYQVRDRLSFMRFLERWSQDFGPVVKVYQLVKEMIQNDETKEPLA
jgi:IS5 family transposase